jgi:BirA family biotin operon repressor/biotin-[acetyl-CoA-carboxylase] ligase
MIEQIHVTECDSTQDLLKEQLNQKPGSRLLISCDHQRKGRGRGTNSWESLPESLCFSINLAPHSMMSLTSLEVSVLLVKFFENLKVPLKLKWPNDLWNSEDQKCGGVLLQGTQGEMLTGVGLNLVSHSSEFGGVYPKGEFQKKDWALKIATHILENRYQDPEKLRADWWAFCGHKNALVSIRENGEVSEGIFKGVGQYGEALLENSGKVVPHYNGTLRIKDR